MTSESDKQITIQGIKFPAPEVRYKIGHRCSTGEAQTLQRELINRLRVNFGHRVREELEEYVNRGGTGETLPGVTIEALREEFIKYASNYQLGIGHAPDPIKREVERLARLVLAERLNKSGKRLSDLAELERRSLIEQLMDSPGLLEEAERRVRVLEEVAIETLGSEAQ